MKYIGLLLFLLLSTATFAQHSGTLRGSVLDAATYNEPLMMASVQLKNSDFKTQTNFSGNFELPAIPEGNYILRISFLGYDAIEQEVNIDADETLVVQHILSPKVLPSIALFSADVE